MGWRKALIHYKCFPTVLGCANVIIMNASNSVLRSLAFLSQCRIQLLSCVLILKVLILYDA